MAESQKTQSNLCKLPNKFKFLILSLPVVITFCHVRSLDNDFYFLYATGEYIVKRGIPYTDMLSMHSSMKVVIQQWLSSLIFYFSYSAFGEYGTLALLYLFNIIVVFLTYRLTKLISRNELISAAAAALIDILIFDSFMVTRPQMFTYALLLAEVCLLEKYVQTLKTKYLFFIPVLSLLLINLHAAMWPMLLVLMLPYLVSAVPLRTKMLKHAAEGDLIILLAVFVVSIVVGVLNPYGFENMIYLFKSYGKDGLDAISEMKPTSWSIKEGIYFFVVFGAAFLVVFFMKKRPFSIRYFLLFSGTILLGLIQIKSIPYAMFFAVPAFTYLFRDMDLNGFVRKLWDSLTKRIKVLFCIFICCSVTFVCITRFLKTSETKKSLRNHYENLNKIVEILNEAEEPIILYANFNDGQYYEFCGFHPYIDGRAELFLASNNNDFDYLNEYLLVFGAKYHYRDFIDKYHFNYLSISKGIDSYLYFSLLDDEDFEIVYDSADMVLFARK